MRIDILNFKQEKLLEYGLSLDEVLILRNIEDFINSGRTRSFFNEEDGLVYHWISYQKILDDLPILNISRDRVSKIILRNLSTKPSDFEEKYRNYTERMKKESRSWKYLGLLKYKLVKNPVEGSKTYFALTDKFYNLRIETFDNYREGENTVSDKVFPPRTDKVFTPSDDKVSAPCQTRCSHRPKDNIYIYKYIVGQLNEKTNKNYKYNTPKTQKLIQARLNEGFTQEDFIKVIDTKVKTWLGTDMEIYLRPETLFGTKFEGYLNEVSREKEVVTGGLGKFKEM